MAAAPVLQSERLKLKLKEGGGERRKGKEWLPGRQLLLNGCLYSLEEGAVNSLTAEAAESYTKLFLSFASNSLSFLVRTDFKTGALKLLSLSLSTAAVGFSLLQLSSSQSAAERAPAPCTTNSAHWSYITAQNVSSETAAAAATAALKFTSHLTIANC